MARQAGTNTHKGAKAQAQTQTHDEHATFRQPLPPDQVPWFDEGFTFADRDRELTLLSTLLAEKLDSVRFEHRLLRDKMRTGQYGLDFRNVKDPSASSAAELTKE